MPVRFDSVPLLFLASGLMLAIAGVAILRHLAIPRTTNVLVLIGLILFTLAAGGMNWRRARAGEVLVMLDVSPSTRTATYRDRRALNLRLDQLLGNTPRRLVLFAQDQRADKGEAVLPEMACDHTVFAPPPAEAILLFSDARFELPAAASRTFIAIDPALEQPSDAAVNTLQIRGRELVANVSVSGSPRALSVMGTAATQPMRIPAGSLTISRPLKAASASAQFSPGDPWPENDGLWIDVPPPDENEKWWVGNSPPPGWRAFKSSELPLSGAAYLSPAVIVLNNVPASALSSALQPLQQYVRDLGGSAVIVGGDRAFAAGNYGGSGLEAISPLASHPPQPAMHWILLIDGSGSMGEATPQGSRWQVAGLAVGQLLAHLPPDDLATLGSFAEGITWWSAGKSVRDSMALLIPPPDLSARGPTNLQRALVDIARTTTGEMPKRLIVVTDADARIDDAKNIAVEMKSKNISLDVLAIGRGSGLDAMTEIAKATGGSVASVSAAESWAAGLMELGRSAMGNRIENAPLPVRFTAPLNWPARTVTPWNRVWLKSTATALAEATMANETIHPVARWRVGAGEVAAVGFAASTTEAVDVAASIARPPHDPRFKVMWEIGQPLRVKVDAVDGKSALNNRSLSLELHGVQSGMPMTMHSIPQTGPGRYELSVPAPRDPQFASVRHDGKLLDQIAVAGRYAPEFDAIGNDHESMHALAQRTGGRVIDARETRAIDFHWPRRDVPLGSWLAGGGALLVALGLMRWRKGA